MNKSDAERIFLLATKKSAERDGTTYCIGVFKLGTDNDREYKPGDEVTYIYSADYTSDMQNALNWLNNVK